MLEKDKVTRSRTAHNHCAELLQNTRNTSTSYNEPEGAGEEQGYEVRSQPLRRTTPEHAGYVPRSSKTVQEPAQEGLHNMVWDQYIEGVALA